MSYRDETRARDYLASKAPLPRPRPILLAIVLLACFIALLALLASCDAAVMEVTVTGDLTLKRGDVYPGVIWPQPYVFRAQYDSSAEDEDADPKHGEFEMEGARLSLNFADVHIETTTTEIETVSGDGPNWGFVIANADPFVTSDFPVPTYGAYFQFLGTRVSDFPTDELSNIPNVQLDSQFRQFYLVSADDSIRLDGTVETFTVSQVVPEAEPWGLAVLGALLCCRHRR